MSPSSLFRPVTNALGVCVAAALALVASTAPAVAAGTAPWPEALHDAAHSAGSSAIGPSTGNLEWSRQLGGSVTPGPTIGADGTIYVATNGGVLHALNPSTGVDLWTFNGGGPFTGETDLSVSPLVLPSGSLLWPGPDDTLYELSSAGQSLWSHRFSAMVLSPVLAGTTVYAELMSGTLWQLQIGTGLPALGWSLSIGHSSFGSPAVGHDGEVITTADKSVVAVIDHGASGAIAWRHQTSASIEVSPSIGPNGHRTERLSGGGTSARSRTRPRR
jgi:outer membrane protein assembly factor BamB